MGEQFIQVERSLSQRNRFTQQLLKNVQVIEMMIERGLFETGVRRIGAEQEIFLVDPSFQAAGTCIEVLKEVNDPHFTTELGRFNLECNLDPLEFEGDCFSKMEKQLGDLLAKGRAAAERVQTRMLLAGILPTLRTSDLSLDNMAPIPRYFALNEAMMRQRGADYEVRISGIDELNIQHDSVMLEACCTSFQLHYQVDPADFARTYNLIQAITAPLLAGATNAPLLFGRRLWMETRIPLFQQSVDTRRSRYLLREKAPRVSFGQQWVKRSIVEIYQEDIARFPVLLCIDVDEEPLALLEEGRFPKLQALRMHTGTVYRWNRACYGILHGKAHLRIENRVLPSGPSILDEVANAAFFYGMVSGMLRQYDDITKVMQFDHAKANFLAVAQRGLDAALTWVHGRKYTAEEIILQELLPIAREGLLHAQIKKEDVDHYLGILEDRIRTRQTGSQWMLSSLDSLRATTTRDQALSILTAAMYQRQWSGDAVHQWPLARSEEEESMREHTLRVEDIMTTDIITVREDEPIELVANLMTWRKIRHVPVEDEQGQLIGLVSSLQMIRQLVRDVNQTSQPEQPRTVGQIMDRKPPLASPETKLTDALRKMRSEGISTLLIVKDNCLVGIVSERDFLPISERLLKGASS